MSKLELMKRRPRNRLSLFATSFLIAPPVALAQSQGLEQVILPANQMKPNTEAWYVDDDGNIILLIQFERKHLELTQNADADVTDPTPANEGVLTKVALYSGAIGALAGLAAGVGLTSFEPEQESDVQSGSVQNDGSSSSGTVLPTCTAAPIFMAINSTTPDAVFRGSCNSDYFQIHSLGSLATVDLRDGDDVIRLETALTASTQLIDGGGGRDDLTVSVNVNSGNYDNIEVLEITSAATDVQLNLFDGDLDTVRVGTTTPVTLTKVAADHVIETDSGADVTFASGTSNKASVLAAGNLTLENASTGSTIEELTVNFSSNSGSTLTLKGTKTTSLVIEEASGDVSLTGLAIYSGAAGVTAISAVALTTDVTVGSNGSGAGNLSSLFLGAGDDIAYVDGGQAGADIKMGAGDDVIDAEDNDDPMDYSGGAGKDMIKLKAANGVQDDVVFDSTADFVAVTAPATSNAIDVVQGFKSGEDKVDLNALNLTGIDKQATLTDAYDEVANGNVDVAYAVDAGDTYVYVDLGSTIGGIKVEVAGGLDDGDFNL